MVIQKDDRQAKDMVNSLRFKSSSPKKFKVWSPELSFEERYRMKRKREDEYVQDFSQQDRPILLIQQKHAYNNLKQEPSTEINKEHYYKISQNTQKVDDVSKEIQELNKFTKRETRIHGAKKKDDDNTSIYKIQGIEFLPEGFIELDPLLYKDEFEFETRVHENIFGEEQRKIKALRRKQYEMRKFQKMRDVTIYLLDERKNAVIEFLENWYFKHKRRMNQDELAYNAELLHCDLKTMIDLQNMFLEKQKYLNSKKLREYLTKHGKIVNNKLIVPPSLKKYFIKKQNPYGHVKSRLFDHYQRENSYEKSKNPSSKHNHFADNVRTSKSTQQLQRNSLPYYGYQREKIAKQFDASAKRLSKTYQYENILSQQMKEKYQQDQNRLTQQMKDKYQQDQYQESLRNSQQYKGQNNPFMTQEQHNFNQNNYDNNEEYEEYDELKMYFDSEVNRILSRIKHSKINDQMKAQCDVDIGKKKKLMNCKKVFNKGEKQFVNNYKNNLMKESLKKGLFSTKQSLKTTKKTSKSNYEKINKKNLVPFKRKESEEKIERFPEVETFGKDKPSPQILHSNFDEEKKTTITQRAKQTIIDDDQTEFKRVTTITKIDDRNLTIEQKLRPTLIGNEYFYQLIEDQLKDGVRNVRLITKSDRGQIINIEEIPKEKITDNYDNYSIQEASQMDGDKKVTLVVQNEKGQSVSTQEIRPLNNTTLGLDDKGARLLAGNFRKSYILEREGEKGEIIRIHTLAPVQIFGRTFQQKVVEEIRKVRGKTLKVITTDDQSRIIFSDKVPDEKQSNHYFSMITSDMIDDQGIREIILETKNEKGQTITQHSFRQNLDDNSIQYKNLTRNKRHSTMKAGKKNGQLIKTYSLPPIILGQEFLKQQIEEQTDDFGQKKLSQRITNQKGQILIDQELDFDKIGGDYFAEVVKDEINKKGERIFTVITKNDRGETMSVSQIKPSINSVLGDEFFENFVFKSRGNTIIKKTLTKNGQKKSKFEIRPTLVGNQYYQQIIQEELNKKGKQSFDIYTKTQDGQIVSKQTVQTLKGQQFMTIVEENKKDPDLVDIKTMNENNEQISKVTLRPIFHNILNEDYMKDFELKKKKTSVINIKQEEQNVVREQQLRPTKIGNQVYQQYINEIVDQQGERSVTIVTKDQLGNIIDAEELHPEANVENCISEVQQNKRGVTMVVQNQDGQNIAEHILNEQKDQNQVQNWNRTNTVSYYHLDDEKNKMIHVLKPIIIGEQSYQQIIEDIIDEKGQRKLQISTQNQNEEQIDVKLADITLKGRNYVTIITSDYIDNEGIRKVVLGTKNDKEEIIAELEIRPEQNPYVQYFDGKQENDLQRTITFEQKKGSTISRMHELRPTFIGNEYFKYVVEEIVNNQGKRQCTLLTLDENNQELGRQTLKSDVSLSKLEVEIQNDEFQEDQRIITVQLKNDEEILAIQKLQSFTAGNINDYNFSDHYDIFNGNGKKVNTISVKREKDFIFRTHSLSPKLIGNTYYQQNVNEILEDDGKKKAMVVTSDENGRIIAREYIQEEMIGDFYKNIVSEDYIDENKQRIITIDTLNEKNEIVAKKSFKHSVQQQASNDYMKNIIMEVETVFGDKTVYKFENVNGKQKVLSVVKKQDDLKVIIEEDEEDQEKDMEFKNRYFEELIKNNKIQRDNNNRFSDVREDGTKQKFNTMHVKDYQREIHQSIKRSKLEELQETEKRDEKIQTVFKRQNSEQDLIEKLKDSYNLDTKGKDEDEKMARSNTFEIAQEKLIYEKKIQEEISNFEREKSLEEHHDFLIEKSEKLKGYLDDYIQTLKKSKLNQLKKDKEKIEQEQFLKKTIEEVFIREKSKMGEDIAYRIEKQLQGKTFSQPEKLSQDDLMDEFYRFCKEKLPRDHNYKESIMFVSLFYYFMEKKNLLKKQQI